MSSASQKQVSCITLFSQWGFLPAFEHILQYIIRNLDSSAFQMQHFLAELCQEKVPQQFSTAEGPAPLFTLCLNGDNTAITENQNMLFDNVNQVPSRTTRIQIESPAYPPVLPLFDTSCLRRLLHLLSPQTVVKCLGYLLNNFSIMLLSEDICDLAPCAEALKALTHPFQLPHVYVLPLDFASCDIRLLAFFFF